MAAELEPTPHSQFHRWVFLPVARLAANLLMLICGPLSVQGKSNVPRKGGLLILANHLSDADPGIVQIVCPRPIHFMAKSELFDMPTIAWALRIQKAFPVKRGEADRGSLRHAADLLKNGEAVCIFPEGQLSEEGKLQELKAGIALIVRMSGADVICCSIRNSEYVVPYGKVLPRPGFHRVFVKWGHPHSFGKGPTTEEILDWTRNELIALGAPA